MPGNEPALPSSALVFLHDGVVSGSSFESPGRVGMLSSSQKAELAACRADGASARRKGVAHFSNPHMDSPLFLLPFSGQAEEFQLDLVEAWWDGWEGADQAPSGEQRNVGA